MATPTPQEIRDAVMQAIKNGVSELQIGDRRIKLMTAEERLAALKEVENSQASPFIQVGFKTRPC
jgi:hypothetical protein